MSNELQLIPRNRDGAIVLFSLFTQFLYGLSDKEVLDRAFKLKLEFEHFEQWARSQGYYFKESNDN